MILKRKTKQDEHVIMSATSSECHPSPEELEIMEGLMKAGEKSEN